MKILSTLSDEAVLQELGARIASTRLEKNLTQSNLAEEAGVSKRTVERLESGEVATQLSGFLRVCRVLGLLERFEGLIPEPPASPMAQLKLRGQKRQRASRSGASRSGAPRPDAVGHDGEPVEAKKWTWGESS